MSPSGGNQEVRSATIGGQRRQQITVLLNDATLRPHYGIMLSRARFELE
jgi:hypothetical protein